MGVLGSGRLANTTSTYSSCSRSRDAFRPAAQTGLSGVLGPILPSSEADGEVQPGTGASSAWQVPSPLSLPSMMCFRDRPLSVSALEKERWVRAWSESLTRAGCSAEGRVLPTFLPRRFWW